MCPGWPQDFAAPASQVWPLRHELLGEAGRECLGPYFCCYLCPDTQKLT